MASNHQLERWLMAVGRGDQNALEQLYEAAAPAVYGMALSILKNEADAEDILQETFVTILRTAGQYQPQGKPMAWIITITKNFSYRLLKRNARYAPLSDGALFSSSFCDPEDRLLLQSCMTRLSDEERQIVILHAVAGCKHRKIAEMLGLSTSTVLSKYHRALKKLREGL